MVSLGYLNGTKEVNETITSEDGSTQITKKIYHEVLNANDYFIVYENGDVIANNGVFNGEINAKSGSFGNNAVKITDTGLVVKEGGLIIQGSGDKTLLSFKDGDLLISGIINAQAGGTIGGFTIKEDQLISQNQDIVLNGEEGTILADNITLGEGAKIASFIQLGKKVKLFGADNETRVLETYKISTDSVGPSVDNTNLIAVTTLYQDGSLKLGENINFNPTGSKGQFGQIVINGADSVIVDEDGGWSITPTMATFSNIDLGTGTIHAARFEINEAQLVGGSMIFKEAYQGKLEGTQFIITEKQTNTLAENFSFKGHWVLFTLANRLVDGGKTYYKVKEYDAKTKALVFETAPDNADGFIDLGAIDEKNDSWIISINSNKGSLGQFGGGEGLTMTEFGVLTKEESSEESIKNTPRLFMGDLSGLNSIGIQGYTGVGLYCDNVYLKGEMTTAKKAAGISTKGDHLLSADSTESIVIWAGADGQQSDPIPNAKFRVTNSGKVYADEGFFTNSIIKGSNIYAANIYGTGPNGAALSIHDTTQGIVFLKDGTETTFGIKGDGMYSTVSGTEKYIIKFHQVSEKPIRVQLSGDDLYTNFNSDSTNRLHLVDNYIYGCGKNENHTVFALFDGQEVKLGVKNSERGTEETRFQVGADATTIYETLTLKGQGSQSKLSFTYKAHKTNEEVDGYDLYIN